VPCVQHEREIRWSALLGDIIGDMTFGYCAGGWLACVHTTSPAVTFPNCNQVTRCAIVIIVASLHRDHHGYMDYIFDMAMSR